MADDFNIDIEGMDGVDGLDEEMLKSIENEEEALPENMAGFAHEFPEWDLFPPKK